LGLNIRGNFGISGASPTDSVGLCVAPSIVDIILFRKSYISFGNVSNTELALKVSKFVRSIPT